MSVSRGEGASPPHDGVHHNPYVVADHNHTTTYRHTPLAPSIPRQVEKGRGEGVAPKSALGRVAWGGLRLFFPICKQPPSVV